MFTTQRSYLALLALTLSLFTLVGCSTHPKPTEERKLFGISVQRYAPQPVYKRTRLVHLPSPVPKADPSSSASPLIFPVIHFEIVDASLEEAAKVLGETSRYSAYCASTVADKRITISALGTVDELAEQIAKIAKIETIVDHHNREVRFLARKESQVVKPQLL
jgi:hypothetical protein